jgi:hypothetical protein
VIAEVQRPAGEKKFVGVVIDEKNSMLGH